ncbi:unnamed protein product [Sphagnum jensenii]|uniref:Uncharacterized protein n=2 Tax=Sphagnum jensenii TaxID=128206 RepID=A0ABP1BRL2_9BRYO
MWRLKQFMPKEQGVGTLEGKTVEVGSLKLQVRSVIAQGGFSCVYLAKEAQTGRNYAVKHIICNDLESLDLVKKEVAVMKALREHPNVVMLHAQVVYDMGRTKECFLVMDFCDKMLATVLENRGAGFYDEKQILLMFREICNAVYAMHCQSPPIAHRDLKVENILMGPDGLWKLCDFGSTSTNHKRFEKADEMGLEEDNIRKYTTPAYRAPEMWDLYQRELINEKVDIWALGCLLYRIAYLKLAFDGESKLQILNGNYRIPDVPRYSSAITDLIRDMLIASPEARPDIMQVWRRVNESLPSDLRKAHPEKPPRASASTATSRLLPSTREHADTRISSGSSKVMPSRAPPVPPKEAERRLVQNGAAGDTVSAKGAFWSTQYAQDAQTDESSLRVEKVASTDSVPQPKSASPPRRSRQPSNSPPKERSSSFMKKSVVSGLMKKVQGSLQNAGTWGRDDPEVDGYEMRHDSDWKIKSSEKSLAPDSGMPSNDPAFNAFAAEFDHSVNLVAEKNEQLQSEIDKLRVDLKQALLDKADMASKYEKLTAICRSQRQEIQDLKFSLGSSSGPNVSAAKEQQASAKEKQSGTIWDLQEGLSPNAASQQKNSWHAFGDPPNNQGGRPHIQNQGLSPSNEPTYSSPSSPGMMVDVRRRKQQQSTTDNLGGGDAWNFVQDSFSPSGSEFHAAKGLSPLGGVSTTGSNASANTENWARPAPRAQPAGWAGF